MDTLILRCDCFSRNTLYTPSLTKAACHPFSDSLNDYESYSNMKVIYTVITNFISIKSLLTFTVIIYIFLWETATIISIAFPSFKPFTYNQIWPLTKWKSQHGCGRWASQPHHCPGALLSSCPGVPGTKKHIRGDGEMHKIDL